MNASHIEKALFDLHRICTENNIDYRVVGSAAVIGAVGKAYRIPGDVDFIYDYSKRNILHKALVKKGYKESQQKFPLPVLARPLTHYRKNEMLLEPRGGEFTKKGFEFPLRFGMKLFFSRTMIKPYTYKLGKARFEGLSREALYLGLNVFMKFMNLLEKEKAGQRKQDLEMLSKNLDRKVVEQIKSEHPGIYLGSFPLIVSTRR